MEMKKLLAASTNTIALLIMSFNSPSRSAGEHYESSHSQIKHSWLIKRIQMATPFAIVLFHAQPQREGQELICLSGSLGPGFSKVLSDAFQVPKKVFKLF